VLKEILHTTDELPQDGRLWVGSETHDDAAVFGWDEENGLISTTDFFMPMVDDAYTFGKIAAANALSDVYAMGGSPLMALAILGWPIEKLPASQASQVLEGARFITKPLGAGIITAAMKRGQLRDTAHLEACVSYMSTLNKIGEHIASHVEVHAMTDVTGFGFAGHCLEMCEASGLTARIDFSALPVYPFLEEYTAAHVYPDMTMKNYSHYASKITQLSLPQLLVMCDPQTSGGLLIAVPQRAAAALEQRMRDFGCGAFARAVGVMVEREEKSVRVDTRAALG